jgi:uncharacterized membrane protein YhaH (DUF805 family)
MKIRDLWRWSGKANRSSYLLTGLILFAVKHNLDRFIASRFQRPWTLWNYLLPTRDNYSWTPEEMKFMALLLVTALPFIWIGLNMTAKRLRDAGQSLWLTAVFFAPLVNLIFFALLCILPSARGTEEQNRHLVAPSDFWPLSRSGSAALAVAVGGFGGAVCAWANIRWLGNYGFSLFVALPFVMGYTAVWVVTRRRQATIADTVILSAAVVLLAGLGIAAIAIEGVICLAMAAPIAWLLAFFGALLARAIHNHYWQPRAATSALGIVLLSVPMMMGAEHAAPPPVPRFQVRTSIEIAAPPEIVWARLIRFPSLDPPTEWPFRYAGMAYPMEARLKGEGLTADRECRFSTGSFKEPILAWEPAKHFAFSVSDEPLLMTETSPYGQIHVRHLEDHDFQPERADFVLTLLPNGRTRLEGTTTYINRMWPGAYWHFWTDAIVHSIHRRVFEHVKRLAETDAQAKAARVSERTRW